MENPNQKPLTDEQLKAIREWTPGNRKSRRAHTAMVRSTVRSVNRATKRNFARVEYHKAKKIARSMGLTVPSISKVAQGMDIVKAMNAGVKANA